MASKSGVSIRQHHAHHATLSLDAFERIDVQDEIDKWVAIVEQKAASKERKLGVDPFIDAKPGTEDSWNDVKLKKALTEDQHVVEQLLSSFEEKGEKMDQFRKTVQEEIKQLEQRTQSQELKYVEKMDEHALQSENVFVKFKEIQDDMNRARSSAAHI